MMSSKVTPHVSHFVKEVRPTPPPPRLPQVKIGVRKFKREFAQLNASLPYLKGLEASAVAQVVYNERIWKMCRQYWIRKWNNNRPTLLDVKPHAARIGQHLDRLIAEWETVPQYVRSTLIEFLELQYDHGPSEIPDMLKDLRGACHEVSYVEGVAGRKRHDELDLLIGQLSAVWTDLTGRVVPKTLAAPSRGASEFTSPAAQFILVLSQAVDPEIAFASVKTALRVKSL